MSTPSSWQSRIAQYRPIGPYQNAVAVTTSDTVNIAPPATLDANEPARALYIGTTGNLVVITAGGDTVTFNAVPVGILPVSVTRVKATSTTASNIVALY